MGVRYLRRRTGYEIDGGSKRLSLSSFEFIAFSTWFSSFPKSGSLVVSSGSCVCSTSSFTVGRIFFNSICWSCSGLVLSASFFPISVLNRTWSRCRLCEDPDQWCRTCYFHGFWSRSCKSLLIENINYAAGNPITFDFKCWPFSKTAGASLVEQCTTFR